MRLFYGAPVGMYVELSIKLRTFKPVLYTQSYIDQLQINKDLKWNNLKYSQI